MLQLWPSIWWLLCRTRPTSLADLQGNDGWVPYFSSHLIESLVRVNLQESREYERLQLRNILALNNVQDNAVGYDLCVLRILCECLFESCFRFV